MQQSEVLAIFEELVPITLALSWDNSGLQVASERKEITHIAVCLDPSPESVQKALDIEADLIFTHHPILLSPKYLNNLEDSYYQIVSLLIKKDISLYSAHTNLDSMPIAHWLADELGLFDRVFLEKTGEINEKEYGIGICGTLKEGMKKNEFLKKVCQLIPHSRSFFALGNLPDIIKKVAICGGSGSSLLEEAKKLGADCLITGDTKYHTALDLTWKNETISIIEVGHHSLEEEMMRRFCAILQDKMPCVRISFIPSNDPFIQIME